MGVDNYFIFDGVDCRRFAIHAFERSSYGADPIQYEARTIPGMDGDCLVSQDRYPNRNVSMKCLIYEDFYTNYERFRAWLMSKVGYFRLELGNHPGEFYYASIRNAIEPTVDRDANMGKFELIFSRKPQRFLKSGERVVTYPSVKEKSGSVVKIDDAAAGNALDVTIGITHVQSGSGDPSPDNVRPISGWTGAKVTVSPSQNEQDGTTYDITFPTEAGTVYGGILDVTTGELTVNRKLISETISRAASSANVGTTIKRYGFLIGTEGVDASRRTEAISDIAPYHADFNGEFTHFLVNTNATYIYLYVPIETDTATEIHIVCPLATPQTYQLTPTQIALLAGVNNVWADTGDIRLQYTAQSIITNPTPYASKPLIRVYGTGEVGIGDTTVTVTSADVYTDIDCEIMESYKGDTPKNQYVEFSTNDYPTLGPGMNIITLGTGITRVEITPRWYIR